MFDKISFFTYEMPETELLQMSEKDERYIQQRIRPASRSAGDTPYITLKSRGLTSAKMAGTVEMFLMPPLSNIIQEHFYHIESFDVFTWEGSCYTLRQDFPSYMLLYTYEGSGFLEYEGKKYTLTPGDGFWIDCMVPQHYYSDNKKWKHSVLHFNGPLVPYLYDQYHTSNSPVFTIPLQGFYQNALEEILLAYTSPAPHREYKAADLISRLLTELLALPASTRSSVQERMQLLRYLTVYIEHHYQENLSLDFLSSFSGISKYHLSREFKKLIGYSPIEYLISLRIKHAQTLLSTTTMTANEISEAVGIHDINNFYQLFKKRTGVTPIEYRNL